MSELFTFALEAVTESDGKVHARIVPFGVNVPNPNGPGEVSFEAGSLTVPDTVPFRITHNAGPGEDVLDHIGFVESVQTTDTAAFASISLVDTTRAQDARALMSSGLADEVSVGVRDVTVTDGVISGTLDHVALVGAAAFGKAAAPSKVLQVFNEKESPPMADETTEVVAPEVAAFDDTELRNEMAALKAQLVEVADANPGEPVAEFAGLTVEHLDMAIAAALERRSDFALADVIGDLGSADASGLNPDFYWSEGLQQNLDRRRPLFSMAGTGPFPSYGLNLTSARVSQDVAVGSGKAQKVETATQALQVIATTFPVVFHSGAVDVALELISQSSPEVTRVLRNSFLSAYAKATNADIAAKALAGGTATTAVLDTSTYAAFVTQIIDTSNLIEDATGMPGDKLAVTPAQWSAINSLVDSADRRQFSTIGSQNADGSASLITRSLNVGGVDVFRDPDVTVAQQFNTETLVKHEKAPQMIQANNVPNMGIDMGIIGATVVSFWPAGLYDYSAT